MSALSRTAASPRPSLSADAFIAVGLTFLAAVVGFGLASLAGQFPGTLGPLVLLAVPLLPVAALAVLVDPRLGAVAVVLVFPIGVTDVPGMQLQVVQLLVVVVAALVMLRRAAAGLGPLPWTPALAWGLGMVAWMLVALPSAADEQRALREVVLFGVGVLFAAVVTAVCARVADVQRFLAVLLALIAGVAALTPFGADRVRSEFGGAVVTGRATGIFVQPNELGLFCAVGALVGFGLAFAAQTARGKAAAGVGAALATVGLLLSLSRGSWIGFVLGVLVLLVKLPEARRALLALSIPLVLAALVVGAFAPSNPQVEVVGERLKSISGERNPYDDRPTIWREALREVVSDPVTGQGPGSFPVASVKATSKSRTVFAEHAHNVVLTWAAENGLPLLGLAVAFAVNLALMARRVARQATVRVRALAAGLSAALVAVLGQGLVDYPLRNAVLFVEVWAVVGALVALWHVRPKQALPA